MPAASLMCHREGEIIPAGVCKEGPWGVPGQALSLSMEWHAQCQLLHHISHDMLAFRDCISRGLIDIRFQLQVLHPHPHLLSHPLLVCPSSIYFGLSSMPDFALQAPHALLPMGFDAKTSLSGCKASTPCLHFILHWNWAFSEGIAILLRSMRSV